MRATISFDVEVEQVENTMAVLAAQEAANLRAAADMIDVQPGPRNMVLEEINLALSLIQETASQLEQYKSMLLSFERARYETMVPQPADDTNMELTEAMAADQPTAADLKSFSDLQTTLDAIQGFESFMNPLTDPPTTATEEDSDQNEEG